ncbi:hypothetical protein PVK06_016784 [Gossypium arboreum]|uniref:RRM domain-containing protein n=1 Tax=Gossypium arboreum TaxID=29729 RepID=A0ABR0Q0X4_GOSAR|nr:hypothetical protein PVK06_016784 [Gossypium arboreum]
MAERMLHPSFFKISLRRCIGRAYLQCLVAMGRLLMPSFHRSGSDGRRFGFVRFAYLQDAIRELNRLNRFRKLESRLRVSKAKYGTRRGYWRTKGTPRSQRRDTEAWEICRGLKFTRNVIGLTGIGGSADVWTQIAKW